MCVFMMGRKARGSSLQRISALAVAIPLNSASSSIALFVSCFSFPFLNQLHDIANVPKALFKAAGHGRGHTNGAVHAGEVIPSRVQRDHVNVVVDLLGMTGCQLRITSTA